MVPSGESTSTFEREDLLLGVHNGRVGGDGPPEDIVGVSKVNDNNLILFVDFLANTNETIRFEC